MWQLAVLTGDRFNGFFSEEMYGRLDLFSRAEKNFHMLPTITRSRYYRDVRFDGLCS